MFFPLDFWEDAGVKCYRLITAMPKGKKKEPDLVEVIKAAIKKSGLSLNELSRQAGVAVPQISRFVSGERGLTVAVAAKLCEALHLRLVDHPTEN